MSKIILVVGVNDSMYNTNYKELMDRCDDVSVDLDIIVYGDDARHANLNEDGTIDKIRGGIGGTIELYSVLGGIRLAVQEACKFADEEGEEVFIAVITDRGVHYGEDINVDDICESIYKAEDKLDVKTVIMKLPDNVFREEYSEIHTDVNPDAITFDLPDLPELETMEEHQVDEFPHEGEDDDSLVVPEEFRASPEKGGFFYDGKDLTIVNTEANNVIELILTVCQ